ncbi:DUF2126 domain-containing protein [Segniliparus rugosus]|uniref:Transglutaminase-like domain-containing protein n=1 Tax=Segniliparus rugosus (strain ATCC BAA-974 / DSM 45345 / CCUG 50838 / CIP 108380 / JCM 13579 / CDC 945) TaxID=679197 RepID=E5XP38_SEGRC|nr:transglutaminase family protein [Segniliparus rugosus]EFV13884.1 hypothetical protein HMPREF9336_01259 [Segniliparus rugosus ATCC BAA-974]
MGIKVALEHHTSYHFDRQTAVYPHVVRLRPAPHTRTKIEAYSLTVHPGQHFLNWQQDPFGNFLARAVFPERADGISFTVSLVADLTPINPFEFFVEDYAEHFGFTYPKVLAASLSPYRRRVNDADAGSGPGELVQAFVKRFASPGRIRTIEHLSAINAALSEEIGYSVRMEAGVQTPEHTLRSKIGSCRDSGWLLVSVLRELGYAARFVSGYLVQLTADLPALDGPSGPTADFTDLHAWTEVFLPGAGWVGLDPTSGLFAAEGHIPLAAAPEPALAAPIEGATDKCEVSFEFSNTVRRIHEDPRVTLPYTDEQWKSVYELGLAVDQRLKDEDVRLTMGGEPTFVSVDDRVSPEWTTAADGPHKRERAEELARRVRDHLAQGALLSHTQGKWYPGEELPRWNIGLHWRTDGEPVWSDASLLAKPWEPAPRAIDPEESAKLAEQFAQRLAAQLGLAAEAAQAAYEDPLAQLQRALSLPEGDPSDLALDLGPDVDSPEARAKLVEILNARASLPAAYVMPLEPSWDGNGWASAVWKTRRGRIVLAEGDSPAGLRLPLDSVGWSPAAQFPPADPTVKRPKLPKPEEREPRPQSSEPPPPASLSGASTTALVAEVRNGHLHVFLPPLPTAEAYVDLVGAVEGTARELGVPVVLEGYDPPSDARLKFMSITPDPGVIEVNVPPVGSFEEQTELLESLYEQARLARLSTESFDFDGTHTGTGGGNHITVGGSTPSDSPLLRRPDLLVSLLTYWQRHPALSYLFSGRFVGPTSQAPRADEGRPESLYEMEVAFAELDRIARSGDFQPWQVDRALRHLLTDLTGNTHRAEFCIDKLYSPDSTRGRLGLLELRGFEMPPHPKMALVQSLLVRSLVAKFWEQPLRAPLTRHGSALHGRYLLPHYTIADAAEIVSDLRSSGIEFQQSWLEPFTEFRFPRIGSVVVGGAELELRTAIEPWHVLGEEATGSGTARYVDSSVERLQIKLVGADPGRFIATCNGIPVPLRQTEKEDVQVAGVRYRAWQPPSALHPTITVDSPLRFELIDRYSGHSLGGATYHVVHPGGIAYDDPPVNSATAQSRRIGRFEPMSITPGAVDLGKIAEIAARIAVDTGAPGILDMRRARTVLR